MITPMMEFTTYLLQALAGVLSEEPLLDLFSVIMLCFVCKMFKILAS